MSGPADEARWQLSLARMRPPCIVCGTRMTRCLDLELQLEYDIVLRCEPCGYTMLVNRDAE